MKQKTKQKIQEKKKEINEQEEKEEQDKRALEEYDKWLVNIISYYESLKYFSTKKSSKKEAQGRHKWGLTCKDSALEWICILL